MFTFISHPTTKNNHSILCLRPHVIFTRPFVEKNKISRFWQEGVAQWGILSTNDMYKIFRNGEEEEK
jgi:hypothetical protein